MFKMYSPENNTVAAIYNNIKKCVHICMAAVSSTFTSLEKYETLYNILIFCNFIWFNLHDLV